MHIHGLTGPRKTYLFSEEADRNFSSLDPRTTKTIDNQVSHGFWDIDKGEPVFNFNGADHAGPNLRFIGNGTHQITRSDASLSSRSNIHTCHTGLSPTSPCPPSRLTVGPGKTAVRPAAGSAGIPNDTSTIIL